MTRLFVARGASRTDAILDADRKLDQAIASSVELEMVRDPIEAGVRKAVLALSDPDYSEAIFVNVSADVFAEPDRVIQVQFAVEASLGQVL